MKFSDIITRFNRYYSWIPRRFFPTHAFLPRQFIFEITYRCNFRCPVCQFRPILKGKVDQGKRELTTEQVIACIKKLPRYSLISLTGGEPFVREDIVEILNESTRLRKIHLITNGSLLTPEICELICGMGIKHPLLSGLVGVDISYYGNLVDGVIKSDSSTTGLSNMLEARGKSGGKYPFINFKIVITEENIPMILPFYKYAVREGVDVCSFLLRTSSSNFDRERMVENLDDVKKMSLAPHLDLDESRKEYLKDQLFEVYDFSKDCKTQLRFSPSVSVARFFELLTGDIDYRYLCCYAPWTFAAISAYGDLFPCSNLKIGSLLDNSLRELWSTDKMKGFRLMLKGGLLSNCKKCCYLQEV